jgi:hypothetical protein
MTRPQLIYSPGRCNVTQGHEQPLILSIRGKRPLAENQYSKKDVREWRKFLVKEVQRQHHKIPSIAQSARCTIDLIFVFSGSNVNGVDLDNLTKPVLDALFEPRSEKDKDYEISGALFGIQDSLIFDLRLRKIGLPIKGGSEEGIDIIITWQ